LDSDHLLPHPHQQGLCPQKHPRVLSVTHTTDQLT
jgi:hypothetical protein